MSWLCLTLSMLILTSMPSLVLALESNEKLTLAESQLPAPLPPGSRTFFDQFLAGASTSKLVKAHNWADTPRQERLRNYGQDILLEAISSLYLAEWKLHYALKIEDISDYFPYANVNFDELDCNKDFETLGLEMKLKVQKTCETFKSSKLEFNTNSLEDLSDKLNTQLKRLDLIAIRLNQAQKNLFLENPLDDNYLRDPVYAGNYLKAKSCLSTMFNQSGPIGLVLKELPQLSTYRAAHESQSTAVYIPIWDLSKLPNSRVNLQDKQRPIVEIKKIKNSIVFKIKTLKAELIKSYNRFEGLDEDELISENILLITQFPFLAGKIWQPNKTPYFSYMLKLASTYLPEKNRSFSQNILVSSLVLLGSIFVPGPGWAISGQVIIRLGTFFYTGTLAGQLAYTSNYLNEIHEFKSRNEWNRLVDVHNPFEKVRAEEIVTGLFQGWFTLGLGTLGEGFAAIKLGDGVVSSQTSQFLRWVHVLIAEKQTKNRVVLPWLPFFRGVGKDIQTSKQIITTSKQRMKEVDEMKISTREKNKILQEEAKKVVAHVKVIQQPRGLPPPRSLSNYQRAMQLLRYVEEDRHLQGELMRVLTTIGDGKAQKIFLKEFVYHLYLTAPYMADLTVTRSQFLKVVKEEIHRIATSMKTDKFLPAYNFFSESSIVARRAAIQALDKLIEKNGVHSKKGIAQLLQNKMVEILEQQKLSQEGLLKGIEIARNAHPFAAQFLEESIARTIANMKTLLDDPKIQNLLVIPKKDRALLPGRNLTEAEYYYEKVLYLSEVVDLYLTQLATNGSRVYLSLKEVAENALREFNSRPAATALNILEMNTVISRIALLARNQNIDVSDEVFSPQNLMDCSIR